MVAAVGMRVVARWWVTADDGSQLNHCSDVAKWRRRRDRNDGRKSGRQA